MRYLSLTHADPTRLKKLSAVIIFQRPDYHPLPLVNKLVHDQVALDTNPILNLATFVTTWMESDCDRLLVDFIGKNFIDQAEYPETATMQNSIVSMIANLLFAGEEAGGTTTVGSSEALGLAMLAWKRRWVEKRKEMKLPYDKPEIIMSRCSHTSVEKFANYFDIKPIFIPRSNPASSSPSPSPSSSSSSSSSSSGSDSSAPLPSSCFTLTGDDVEKYATENTVAVIATLGTTFTGSVADIESISQGVRAVEERDGWKIPIHIDAASGGFFLPFAYPSLEWDFRVPEVSSISLSNHKYGFVYPGLGTLIFRRYSDVSKSLIFNISYLGESFPDLSLNFTRSAAPLALQYYNFVRLGRAGYENIMKEIDRVAKHLRSQIIKLKINDSERCFRLIDPDSPMPIVVFTSRSSAVNMNEFSRCLRIHGWHFPVYSLPGYPHIKVARVVVKESFNIQLCERFVNHVREVINDMRKKASSHRKRGKSKDRAKKSQTTNGHGDGRKHLAC